MRSSIPLVLAALAGLQAALAYPGMGQKLEEIKKLKPRQSSEMIGDLAYLEDDELTPTGRAVRDILNGDAQGEDLTSTYLLPPPRDSAACAADTCCIWKYIANEMRDAMIGSALRCNNVARAAVRLGFHDAGTWSKSTGTGGGADGSVVLAGECEARTDNLGLAEICTQMRTWYNKYKGYGVSMADLIQMAANVGTVVCPLGPRVRSFVGRLDSSQPSPTGLLPSPFDSVDDMLELFADKTIDAHDLVALVGAHSTSQQRFVDTSRAGDPQDRTPGVWDVNFYGETMNANSPRRIFKFQSDILLSQDPRTRPTWLAFTNQVTGQIPWNLAYARAYVRLSLLGVYNINSLTECTKVLPPIVVGTFLNPDQILLDLFLNGPRNTAASDVLFNGDLLSVL
ncbi:ligninase H2 precursor [Stachybotrys elegans]|uniref:Peroxidase n=1 Tax=Stachybotrys elegans TaxID=80388 RepID=A0A8K0WNV3_9HYPO|nr:ligninase H2 precursor [Stachybotrys elegans]